MGPVSPPLKYALYLDKRFTVQYYRCRFSVQVPHQWVIVTLTDVLTFNSMVVLVNFINHYIRNTKNDS